MGGFERSDWVGLGVVLAVCLIPIIAVSVLSFRMNRRGWWLGGPVALFLILSPLTLQALHSAKLMEDSDTPAAYAAISMIVGAWIGLSAFLIILAIAGPKLPTLAIRDVF